MTEKRDAQPGKGVKTVRRRLANGKVKVYRYDRAKRKPREAGGDLRQLFNLYSESPEFKVLAQAWRERKLWLYRLIEQDLGWMTTADLEDRAARTDFYKIRDKHAALPHRADKMIQALSSALAWAYDRGMLAVNHAQRIKPLVDSRLSPHADKLYTAEQEETLLAKLPDDQRRLYLVALYTGLRRGDLCRLQWSALGKDGWLVVRPRKTMRTTNIEVHFPTHAFAPLAAVLAEMPRVGPHMLSTMTGIAWDETNLSLRWLRQMRALGFDGMRFHDIRHTTSNRLIDAGCTEAERGIIMGNHVSTGSGRAYVARTRELALNAFRRWGAHMERGAEIIDLEKISAGTG